MTATIKDGSLFNNMPQELYIVEMELWPGLGISYPAYKIYSCKHTLPHYPLFIESIPFNGSKTVRNVKDFATPSVVLISCISALCCPHLSS